MIDPKDPLEGLIDKTLHALRDAQPSPALESRVLAAVRRHQPRPASRLSWMLPLVAVAAALLFTVAVRHAARPDAPSAPLTAPLTAQSSGLLARPVPQHLPMSVNPLDTPRTIHLDARSSMLWAQTKARQPSSLAPIPQDPLAELALRETLAPSQLAPPMPLTEQERLLLRATRPGSPTELAQLEPSRELALRSALDARQKSAVQQYIERTLATLAISESYQPTPPVPETEDTPKPEVGTPPAPE